MSNDLDVQPFTLDPELQMFFQNLSMTVEPMIRMLQDIHVQIGRIPPVSPEIQQLAIQCIELCRSLVNSEELQLLCRFQVELAEQLKISGLAEYVAEVARQILEANPDILQTIPEPDPEELASQEVETTTLDWFEQVLPIERREIWENIDNKNELLRYAVSMASIVLPRLAIPPDAPEIRDATDTALLFLLAVVFLNILISAFDKGGDQR